MACHFPESLLPRDRIGSLPVEHLKKSLFLELQGKVGGLHCRIVEFSFLRPFHDPGLLQVRGRGLEGKSCSSVPSCEVIHTGASKPAAYGAGDTSRISISPYL
jgi:hypothetical protein